MDGVVCHFVLPLDLIWWVAGKPTMFSAAQQEERPLILALSVF